MGAESHILCLGMYKTKLKECLDYDKTYYQDVEPGNTVTSSLFHCVTSVQSGRLAKALGLEDTWDFNNFKIDKNNIKWANLEELCKDLEQGEEQLLDFRTLIGNGFVTIFMPNF